MNSPEPTRPKWPMKWVFVSLSLLSVAGVGCVCQPRPASDVTRSWPLRLPVNPLDSTNWIFPHKADQGYTLVLPGIWGSQAPDHRIVQGLVDAEAPCAIDLCDWTDGPLLLLSNLRAWDRNRCEAQVLARRITDYQDRYPGRPVNLIGYSGGAAMAVLTLEALPPERRVSSVVLLAATLAPDYDLRSAASHTEHGIHSFHSPLDVPLLMVLISAVGTSEGRHSFAAGAVGFQPPAADRRGPAAAVALFQQKYTWEMFSLGHPGGHFGWTNPAFVARWVAPLIGSPAPPDDAIRITDAPVTATASAER